MLKAFKKETPPLRGCLDLTTLKVYERFCHPERRLCEVKELVFHWYPNTRCFLRQHDNLTLGTHKNVFDANPNSL
jgi:hypothetical protein